MTKLVAALVVLLVGALALAGWQAREAAGARAVAIAADARADSAGRRADAKAAVFFHDTTVVLRAIRRVDTVLTRIIDTALVNRTDTVRVPVTVLVAARDTMRACSALVLTCGEALAARTEERDKLRTDRDAWKRAANAARCWFRIPCPVVTVGGSVVLADGHIRYGPSVSVGIPIRF